MLWLGGANYMPDKFIANVGKDYQNVSGIDPVLYGNRDWEYSSVLYTCPFSESDVVLDIGCGFSYFILMVADSIKKGYGMDDGSCTRYGGIFEGQDDAYNRWLDTLEKYPNYQNKKIEIITQSASSLPFPDKYFDTVVTFSAFEHFLNEDDILASQEVNRVLKDNGSFCGTVDFNPCTEHPVLSLDGSTDMNYRAYTHESFFRRVVNPADWVLLGDDRCGPEKPDKVDYLSTALFFSLNKGLAIL